MNSVSLYACDFLKPFLKNKNDKDEKVKVEGGVTLEKCRTVIAVVITDDKTLMVQCIMYLKRQQPLTPKWQKGSGVKGRSR